MNRKGFGEEPIEIAIDLESKERTRDVIETILENAPTTVRIDTEPVLNYALQDSFPLNTIDLIVRRPNTVAVHIHKTNLSLDQLQVICRLLPKLKSFGLDQRWAGISSFMYGLGQLQNAKRLSTLSNLNLPSLDGIPHAQQTEILSTFQKFLQNKTKLQSVELSNEGTIESTKLWCHVSLSVLSKNTNIRSFLFHDRDPEQAYLETKQDGLNMLQSENLTLKEFKPWQDFDENVSYYLDLNDSRRILARDASASQMGEMLSSVSSRYYDSCMMGPYRRETDDLKFSNIFYGLLRETPGSWSRKDILVERAVVGRARKRKQPGSK